MMKIKRKMPKLASVLLCFSMVSSNLLPAYATEAVVTETSLEEAGENGSNEPENDTVNTVMLNDDMESQTDNDSRYEEIEVNYSQSSTYFVTIPKTITLGADKKAAYSVKVEGDIVANKQVCVVPVDGIEDTEVFDFYMADQIAGSTKEDVVAEVSQAKFYWNHEETAAGYTETDNYVAADSLSAGKWKGTFQMEISMRTDPAHIHNYVGEVTKEPTCTEKGEKIYTCDCGDTYTEEIPAKGHRFENGECTDCGEKEADPYETALASAYINWDYTLDDENGMITLNYYKGSETDVIVYANYIINGKTYKTQIASYGENGTSHGYYMFNASVANDPKKNIKSIKFSHQIDTGNVTDMRGMFCHCNSLVNLDISRLDTRNVTNMNAMFASCYALPSLDVTNFDTGNVTDMSEMFSECYKLTSLDVSNFDTSNVTNMNGMFTSCSTLTSIDLSNFDTNKVANMMNMFYNSYQLKTIYATEGKWSTALAESTMYNTFVGAGQWKDLPGTTSMFYNCGTSSATYK